MADDDHNPASDIDGQSGGSGFAKFGDSERQEEQRAKRKGLVGKTVAGVVVLAAVAAVAAFTGGHAKKAAGAADPETPVAGKVTTPIPPQVLFVSDKLGYALYLNCDAPPVGEGCAPQLYRTLDGTATTAASWTKVVLPPSAPVDPSLFVGIQADGPNVLLAWQTFQTVSTSQGARWKTVKVDPGSSVSTLPRKDFLVGSMSPMLVVDPAAATGVTFRAPQNVTLPGVTGGQLWDSTLWMRDPQSLGISANSGLKWNVQPRPDGDIEVSPLAGPPGFLAMLSGVAAGSTTGVYGDGGEQPAAHAYFTTNYGSTWSAASTLTGPAVNVLCTVYLEDKSLLGVAVDGKSLLTLTPGKSVLTRVASASVGKAVPSCLQSHGQLVWGATFSNTVALSINDGAHWTLLPLPTTKFAVATPSPSPSGN